MLAYFNAIPWQPALLGGVLIGLSAITLLLFNGRIAGICGIAFSLMGKVSSAQIWRVMFVFGLLAGTLLAHQFAGAAMPLPPSSNLALIIAAGLLVGFGSSLANGCTSGHGVCGMARLSLRSVIATVTFMLAGFVMMAVAAHVLEWI